MKVSLLVRPLPPPSPLYLFRCRNLHLGFFRSFDHHHRLLLEVLQPADVGQAHIGQRSAQVKEPAGDVGPGPASGESGAAPDSEEPGAAPGGPQKGYAAFSRLSVTSKSCWEQLLIRPSSTLSTSFSFSISAWNSCWFCHRNVEMWLFPLGRQEENQLIISSPSWSGC